MLDGSGGNLVASIGDDGVLLIDADYAPWVEAHAAAIAGIDPDAASPRFLLNTHWHGDHVGGNDHWGTQGTVIMAHEKHLSAHEHPPGNESPGPSGRTQSSGGLAGGNL